jgi:tetratricopeptide (TPR) repeat protein
MRQPPHDPVALRSSQGGERPLRQSWSELLQTPPPPGGGLAPRPPGFIVGRYQLINEIGRGGMSHVYRVLDRLTGRVVTLKRLHPADSQSGGARGSAGRMLLAREFELLASLRHPNIISVVDYGFDENHEPYLTMDLEENACTIIEAAVDRPMAMQVELLVQALRALVYLHRHGIIHRDLKPENILVVGGQVRVLDFGLSVPRASIEAGPSDLGGTLDYMAPEILDGSGRPSEASDLYALGLVAYEIFAAEYPFPRKDALALQRAILKTTLPRGDEKIDPRLLPILRRLLARNPAERYRDAGDVIRDLGVAVDQPFPVETVATRESLLQAAPFVGRTAEIEKLTEIVAQAAEGAGSAWLVGGESGVGKSRLIGEIRTRALVSGMIVVRGQGMSQGGGPYHVWRDILARLILGVELSDTEAAVLQDIVPNIGVVLARRLTPPPPVEAEAALSRLFVAVEQVFRRQTAPVLAILEDLQWVGSESLNLWRWLVRAVEGLPVVLLGSFRDDETPKLPQEMEPHGVLSLKRLTKDEIATLGEAMIGDVGRQSAVIDFLARETEGIPFFIVEVARALAEETGELNSIEEGKLPERVLPGGMRKLIRARLDRVPAGTYRMLQGAAVVGRDIDLDLMHTLYAGADLDSWVNTCAGAAVLVMQDGNWRFAHDKLREQLLADLSPDTARLLNRGVAEALELTHPGAPQYFSALAHHWRAADNPAREADYVEKAGMQALQSGACIEAVGYLTRAVLLLKGGGDDEEAPDDGGHSFWRALSRIDPNAAIDPSSPAFRLGVLEGGLTEAYHRLGDPEGCLDHGRRALNHFAQYVPSSRSMWTVDVLRQVGVRLAQGIQRRPSAPTEQKRQVAGAVARVQQKMTEAFYYSMLPLQLIWSSLRQVNQAWPAGPSRDLAEGYAMIGVLVSVTRAYPLARRWCQRAREIAAAACSPRDHSLVLLREALVHLSSCRWEEGEEDLRLAFRLADEVGDFRLIEEHAVIVTAAYLYTGRYQMGLERIDLALRVAQRAGDKQIERWAVMGHGDLYVRLNRNEEAIRQYQNGLAAVHGSAMKTESIWGHGMLALARLRTGDVQGAFAAASASLELIRSTQPVAYWMQHGVAATVEVFITLLQAPQGLDRDARAVIGLRARQACAGLRNYARRFLIGVPPLYVWEGARAAAGGKRRRALRFWGRAVERAQEQKMPYEEGRAHLEIGRSGFVSDETRGEHLRRAHEIFERIGCGYELELTRRQL